MRLTHAQKQDMYEYGFVKIPGVIPQAMVHEALRAINHSIGEGMNKEDMTTMRSQSFCPELRSEPVITDLFNRTPALALAESAVGAGCLKPIGGGQIAVRFPVLQDPPPVPNPHLDGMHSPHNGVPKGKILNFTLLAAVFLSDAPVPFSGNFTVWPGTHHRYEQYFREHGPRTLLDGMPPIEMPAPYQLPVKTGDLALCHYQVAHTAAPNVSPFPRYAIFFRLNHVNHDDQREEAMKDIWMEWEGMKDIVEARRG